MDLRLNDLVRLDLEPGAQNSTLKSTATGNSLISVHGSTQTVVDGRSISVHDLAERALHASDARATTNKLNGVNLTSLNLTLSKSPLDGRFKTSKKTSTDLLEFSSCEGSVEVNLVNEALYRDLRLLDTSGTEDLLGLLGGEAELEPTLRSG